MSYGLSALLLTGIAILSAVKTKRCTESLFAVSVVAAIIFYKGDFLREWVKTVCSEVAGNTWLWLMCGLFGSLTALFEESESVVYFSKTIAKHCKTQRASLLATFFTGLFIFTDDYLNIITVPLCMKETYAENRIPREALAYLTDCTGTPVCTIVPISSWAAFYGALFFGFSAVSSAYKSPLAVYLSVMPYLFYPIITLVVAFLYSCRLIPDFRKMADAFARQSDVSLTEKTVVKDGNIFDFMLPILCLIAVSIIADEILVGIACSLALCFLLYVPRKKIKLSDFMPVCIKGFCKMVPVMFLLTSCYTLKNITAGMGMSEYVVDLFAPVITPYILPVLSFIISALLSVSTGVVWGTSVITVPMLVPLAQSSGADMNLVMAAVVSGGIFGAQACIYADTTVMTANSCGITSSEHLFSELPYICIPAGISVLLYTVLGFIL